MYGCIVDWIYYRSFILICILLVHYITFVFVLQCCPWYKFSLGTLYGKAWCYLYLIMVDLNRNEFLCNISNINIVQLLNFLHHLSYIISCGHLNTVRNCCSSKDVFFLRLLKLLFLIIWVLKPLLCGKFYGRRHSGLPWGVGGVCVTLPTRFQEK